MAESNIYVFHISIKGPKPNIWRKLRVPGNFTLADLSRAIQIVFGWTGTHLHSFTIKGVDYMPDEELSIDMHYKNKLFEDDYTLDGLGLSKKEKFLYIYDFGDYWEHRITVSSVIPFNKKYMEPLCLRGKYAHPIEDSGGVWGYAEILKILKDPNHPEYEETLELAGNTDPLFFDAEQVNRHIREAFKPAMAGESSSKKSSWSSKAAGNTHGNEVPDEKLKKLCALMDLIKELEPWNKLLDREHILIEIPGEEPVICSVMGKGGNNFGVAIYPGFNSIASLLRIIDSDSENPYVFMGYQSCLMCHLGQQDEPSPEERTRLKEPGIGFPGKCDWVFRKVSPGLLPWYINSKDADTLIEILCRFIDAYTAFEGGIKIDSGKNQIIRHRYSEQEDKWITETGDVPPIPVKRELFKVDSNYVEPLKFKKKTKTVVEAETLYFPQAVGNNDDGVPVPMRINFLVNNKTGKVLGHCILDVNVDENNSMIDMLFHFMQKRGRPETIMVRDKFAAGVVEDFCEKIDVKLVHSKGMPAVDEFAKKLPSFLNLLSPPSR
ncbi:MAG: plasmid pRiA4b ORF-3 family protein [Spirochaetaceae bacterium]|jgi:hypothetical protein|nr:plasmid pRiA4b ORF-3 family protein [Spirochaetaceae bacterium]